MHEHYELPATTTKHWRVIKGNKNLLLLKDKETNEHKANKTKKFHQPIKVSWSITPDVKVTLWSSQILHGFLITTIKPPTNPKINLILSAVIGQNAFRHIRRNQDFRNCAHANNNWLQNSLRIQLTSLGHWRSTLLQFHVQDINCKGNVFVLNLEYNVCTIFGQLYFHKMNQRWYIFPLQRKPTFTRTSCFSLFTQDGTKWILPGQCRVLSNVCKDM